MALRLDDKKAMVAEVRRLRDSAFGGRGGIRGLTVSQMTGSAREGARNPASTCGS